MPFGYRLGGVRLVSGTTGKLGSAWVGAWVVHGIGGWENWAVHGTVHGMVHGMGLGGGGDVG